MKHKSISKDRQRAPDIEANICGFHCFEGFDITSKTIREVMEVITKQSYIDTMTHDVYFHTDVGTCEHLEPLSRIEHYIKKCTGAILHIYIHPMLKRPKKIFITKREHSPEKDRSDDDSSGDSDYSLPPKRQKHEESKHAAAPSKSTASKKFEPPVKSNAGKSKECRARINITTEAEALLDAMTVCDLDQKCAMAGNGLVESCVGRSSSKSEEEWGRGWVPPSPRSAQRILEKRAAFSCEGILESRTRSSKKVVQTAPAAAQSQPSARGRARKAHVTRIVQTAVREPARRKFRTI